METAGLLNLAVTISHDQFLYVVGNRFPTTAIPNVFMFPDINYARISRPIWANTVTIIIAAPIRCEEYEPIHSFLIFFFAIIFLKKWEEYLSIQLYILDYFFSR